MTNYIESFVYVQPGATYITKMVVDLSEDFLLLSTKEKEKSYSFGLCNLFFQFKVMQNEKFFKGSYSPMFFKIDVLKTLANFTKNTCVRVSFNKVTALKA